MRNKNLEKMKEGIKQIGRKKILLVFPCGYVVLAGVSTYKLKQLLEKMGEPFSWKIMEIALYIFMAEILLIGIMSIFSALGTPRKSKKIEGELVDIGFVDNERNAPLLLSRKKDRNGMILEFYSPRIPFYKYEDHRADIENAMNIKIIEVKPGRDMQHILVKAIKAGGEKPEIIRWRDDYLSEKDFEIVLGESYFGVEAIDISITPHILIGGGTGSGKSKLLKLVLMECVKKRAIVYLADFKGGVDYPASWHKVCSIITEPENLRKQLEKILSIIEERRNLFVDAGASNIMEFNKKTGSNLRRIILACDEIAELLDKTGLDKEEKILVNQIESSIATCARIGRAFGIHLILATQRPSADILNGQIKNNIGYRICGRADKVLSQIILDNSEGADRISADDQGLFYTNTKVLFKAYYVEDDCLEGEYHD